MCGGGGNCHPCPPPLYWRLCKLFTVLGGIFKFSAHDSDLEHLCWQWKNSTVSFLLKATFSISKTKCCNKIFTILFFFFSAYLSEWIFCWIFLVLAHYGCIYYVSCLEPIYFQTQNQDLWWQPGTTTLLNSWSMKEHSNWGQKTNECTSKFRYFEKSTKFLPIFHIHILWHY